MYYCLCPDFINTRQSWKKSNNNHVFTISGTILDRDKFKIEFPFKFNVTRETDDASQPQAFYDYHANMNTMSKRLVETLQNAGVDNLQIFPAEVTDTLTGTVHDDFVVVNILGLVSAANLDKSEAYELADVHLFEKIVIDPSKVIRLRMFRLMESQIEIIMDEQVALALQRGNFNGFTVEPLEENAS